MDLDLQISVRSGGGGKERERQAGWQKLPRNTRGWYENRVLWAPQKESEFFQSPENSAFPEQVFFDLGHFDQSKRNGIAIVSHGKAEVWVGSNRIIGIDKEIITRSGISIRPSQAVNPGGRAELYFSQPKQSIDLIIKVDGQTVREVRIVADNP